MINKIWNNKIKGIPGVIFILLQIVYNRVLNYWFFIIHKNNFYSIQKGTFFYRGLFYRYPQNIQIGKNCIINRNVYLGSECNNSFLKIGDNVSIAVNVKLDFTGDLTIKNNVTISEKVSVFTHDHGYDPRSKPQKKELLIEENVWIGSNSIILQNVTRIGKNSIIAAGSIVTKDVDDNIIVGGNPAKKISK